MPATMKIGDLLRGMPTAITPGPLWPEGWCARCSQVGCQCPMCHGAGYFQVPDESHRVGVTRECDCGIVQARRVEVLAAVSILRDFPGVGFATFDPRPELVDAFVEARRFADNPVGWLVLHGDVGVGKTHLAAAIGNAIAERSGLVAMHVMPALLRDLRREIAESQAARMGGSDRTEVLGYNKLFDAVLSVPILILDDVGSEYGTRWAVEQTWLIVEERYRRRLPLVVTTNAFRALEPRVVDRLTDEGMSVVVEIRAGSYRQIPPQLRGGAQ